MRMPPTGQRATMSASRFSAESGPAAGMGSRVDSEAGILTLLGLDDLVNRSHGPLGGEPGGSPVSPLAHPPRFFRVFQHPLDGPPQPGRVAVIDDQPVVAVGDEIDRPL